jgi:hypothetical protein
LHPATFLIDQNRRFAAHNGPEIVDEAPKRLTPRNISLEDDEAPRLCFAKEAALFIRQL